MVEGLRLGVYSLVFRRNLSYARKAINFQRSTLEPSNP